MTLNLQISRKLANDTIVVIGGEDYDNFRHNLLQTLGESGRDAALAEFYQLVPDGKAVSTPPATPPVSAPPQAPASMPAGEPTKTCQHGQRKYIEGVSKKGNAYKMWACPTDRDDPTKCAAVFVK